MVLLQTLLVKRLIQGLGFNLCVLYFYFVLCDVGVPRVVVAVVCIRELNFEFLNGQKTEKVKLL